MREKRKLPLKLLLIKGFKIKCAHKVGNYLYNSIEKRILQEKCPTTGFEPTLWKASIYNITVYLCCAFCLFVLNERNKTFFLMAQLNKQVLLHLPPPLGGKSSI